MASCLVLGGVGCVGSHLAEALLQARALEVFTGGFLNLQVLMYAAHVA